MSQKIPSAIAITLLLIGLGVSTFAVQTLKRHFETLSFPTVEGTVVMTNVKKARIGRYFPFVHYKYVVNGQEYINDRIEADTGKLVFRFKSQIKQYMERHAVGSGVTVYYDPHDPQTSFLEVGIGAGDVVIGLVGIVVTTIGLISLIEIGRQRRNRYELRRNLA